MHRLISIALGVALLGCGSSDEPSTSPANQLPAMPTDFPLTIGTGTAPSISWSGGNARGVYIQEAPRAGSVTTQEMWSFMAVNRTIGVTSSLTYGTMPANAFCDYPGNVIFPPFVSAFTLGTQCPAARPLQRGVTYMIGVERTDGREGAAYFTP